MVCSKEFEEKCSLKEKVEDDLTVDLFNQLDDNEADIEKIAKQTFKILWETSKKTAEHVIEECQADGKTFYTEDQKKNKTEYLKEIFFKEKLKLLKEFLENQI